MHIMKDDIIKKLEDNWSEDEELIALYKEWGDSKELQCIFEVLSEYNPLWNYESELGSWAPEFIFDLLEDVEIEIDEMSDKEKKSHFQKLVEERYDDFCDIHRFSSLNNIRINNPTADTESELFEEANDKIAFPIFKP